MSTKNPQPSSTAASDHPTSTGNPHPSSTPIFNQMIRELCEELDIHYSELSDGWVFRLERDGVTHFISGNRFDLNPAAAGAIADDKVSTYEVLHSQGTPAVPHYLIYNPGYVFGDITPNFSFVPSDLSPNPNSTGVTTSRDLYLNSLPYPVVIKPNHGSRGRDVYLCHDRFELESRLDLLLGKDETICVSPYFPAEFEYRCFFLDGDILLIYAKKREKDSFHHNLSHGATPVLLDENSPLYPALASIAIAAGTALGLRFATIDILSAYENSEETHKNPQISSAYKNSEKPLESSLKVLEVNPGVTTTIFAEKAENGYDYAKNIYRQALKHLFSL